MSNKAVYRILDANANRLREGLRTVEEYFRFVCDQKNISGKLKNLRHQISHALFLMDKDHLLSARDSAGDVGKKTSVSEKKRPSLESIVEANLKRCEESSRVLEEYGKLVNVKAAEEFKKIRFQLYALEKNIMIKFPLNPPKGDF